MILGRQLVAISAESAESAADVSPCTFTPVRYEVTITGWDFRDHSDGQDVVFTLLDEAGRRQGVRFGLSDLELASGQLDRFIATVLQREPAQPKGMEPHFAHQMQFNHLVGRRVLLLVVETSRGVQVVVDWEAVPQE